MSDTDGALVDWTEYNRARAELGADFIRILGYFREDGVKSLAAIEEAMRVRSAAALVIPAHTLKGDSAQFGGLSLATLAEHIEMVARRCVEHHEAPDELLAEVVRLRPLFLATLEQFEQSASPLAARRPAGFGRKAAGVGSA